MPCEEVLESEVRSQVPALAPIAVGEILAVTGKFQRLRQMLPASRLALEDPQIPIPAHFQRTVAMQVILRHLDNPSRVERDRAHVLLENGCLREVHRTNHHVRKSRPRRRQRNRRQEIAKHFQDALFRKILAPNAQVSLIGHARHYSGMRARSGNWQGSEREDLLRDSATFSSSADHLRRLPRQNRWTFPSGVL